MRFPTSFVWPLIMQFHIVHCVCGDGFGARERNRVTIGLYLGLRCCIVWWLWGQIMFFTARWAVCSGCSSGGWGWLALSMIACSLPNMRASPSPPSVSPVSSGALNQPSSPVCPGAWCSCLPCFLPPEPPKKEEEALCPLALPVEGVSV